MDATNADIIKVTGSMDNLIASSNQWCLWGIFVAEIVFLFIEILFL